VSASQNQFPWRGFLLIALFVIGGCTPSQSPVLSVESPVQMASIRAQGGGEGPLFAGKKKATTPSDDKGEEEKKEETEEDKDYWADVEFGRENFEEIGEFIERHYIDPEVNQSRAWAEACSYMLMGLESPWWVLPTEFYQVRKGHVDEEGALQGKTKVLREGLGITMVRVQEPEEKKKRKRLSDTEIREARKKADARREFLNNAWSRISFDRTEFDHCFAVARRVAQADPKQDKESLDKDFWLWASQGRMRSLDPHSSVVSAAAWDESTQKTEDSSFDGIGAILTQRDERTIVESPISGQPAVSAGVRAGDVIVAVDGNPIAGLPLGKVVRRIRGVRGTVVRLTIRREGEPEDIVIPITRAYIEIQNVQGREIEHHPGMGYVKLSGFIGSSALKIREELTNLSEKFDDVGGLRGLVLDLRNNSGGLLQQAVEVSNIFLNSGEIVTVKDRYRSSAGHAQVYRASAEEFVAVPLVVLVNDSSASASEIVAGAIQDNARGIIVGDRTFGKASVQTLFNPLIGEGYYIKLTVARYYAPSGRTIQVQGVHPDFPVAPDVDGEMPLGFREENLGQHLTEIEADYISPNAGLQPRLTSCASNQGIAERVQKANPNPQIRYDYQLMKAADYLECIIDAAERLRVDDAGTRLQDL
jgi:C-terminal peptidase prc